MLWWKTLSLCTCIWWRGGVTKSIDNLRGELIRNMKLMGLTKISQLSKENLRF